ncbi:polyprenyl synthetase family protein [Proteiniclasticum ruminis]|uniref:Farnesyl diphosphate synthase n=1 Tax=Proteiniclasticum ruminis TaxID=398199 RepID=A0A1I4Y562_9CLOT|nr:farnesyl diphosphate synthase [Proteiniclasticum ruminis]SFN33228.1 farnesyl-diphosphate synthase [Proteiniclasticum ruminis]
MIELKNLMDTEILNYFRRLPDNTITKAMTYSMSIGGKRLRPVLCLLTGELFGKSKEDLIPMALAMEMIHTYSLIHDDLPAMDNDDYRRGKLTSHKVFGEANAILAGDALLNEAFTVLLECYAVHGEPGARAALYISRCSGRNGMILGQVMDLHHETHPATFDELRLCHHKKTGALITAAVCAPAVYAGAKAEEIKLLEEYAGNLGLAFQIQDDILDVTSTREVLGKSVGKDEKSNKTTYVGLFGVDKSRDMAKEATEACLAALSKLRRDTTKLEELTKSLMERTY